MFNAPVKVDNNHWIDPVDPADQDRRLVVRGEIDAFEKRLQGFFGSERGDMDQINDDGLREWIIPGVYIRELFIPKGHTVVSKIWKRTRFWVIAHGEVTFRTEMGMKRVRGPYRQIVPLGSKVALYTHEDTLWFAMSATEAETTDDVEGDVIAKDYSECVYPWDEEAER